MNPKVTELDVIKAINNKGLIAILNFVVDYNYYIGSVGLYKTQSQNKKYRLVYPTKLKSDQSFPIYYPINKHYADSIEKQVISLYIKNND